MFICFKRIKHLLLILKKESLNNKGMALFATLIFVFVLTSIGVALLSMTNNDSKLSTLQRESNRAFYIAETGIEKALWLLNFSPGGGLGGFNWNTGGGSYEEQVEDGRFVVTVNDIEEDGNVVRKIVRSTGIVDSSGQFDRGERTIEVIMIKGNARNESLAYNYAVLTDNNMTINGNIFINGDIHANGDLRVAGGSFELANGTASATGTITGYPSGTTQVRQSVPMIDFDYYYNKAVSDGVYYGENTSVIFNTSQNLQGIHYIDGDVIIKPPAGTINITDGAIFATGTITVQGNIDIYVEHSEGYNIPYSLVAKGDITIGGNVHGEGIIQTDGRFTLNGGINIQKGAVVARDGVFNGGGGTMNIVYDNGFQEEVVVGTYVEVWKKLSWQEI